MLKAGVASERTRSEIDSGTDRRTEMSWTQYSGGNSAYPPRERSSNEIELSYLRRSRTSVPLWNLGSVRNPPRIKGVYVEGVGPERDVALILGCKADKERHSEHRDGGDMAVEATEFRDCICV